MSGTISAPPRPLCVDLDGTLVRTNTLEESFVLLLRRAPWLVCVVPFWLLRGKTFLKAELARRFPPDPALLPYREDLLAHLRAEAHARPVHLVTGSAQDVALAVARHLGFFSGVEASDRAVNLRGRNKRRRLEERFGPRGFDYAGDAPADLAVWSAAHSAILAGPATALEARVRAAGAEVSARFPNPSGALAALPRALRVQQWVKNILILLPLLFAHRFAEKALLVDCALAFLAFCCAASAAYLINDLFDLPFDRRHAVKRRRPFAAGDLPLWAGLAGAPLLVGAAAVLCLWLPAAFARLLLLYFALTSVYSLLIKRWALADVVALAVLYTLRILAGGAAVEVVISPWLLALSIFTFSSIALAKRVSELTALARRDSGDAAAGRGYRTHHLPALLYLGLASGGLACLVLAFYMLSPDVARHYSLPRWLWPAAPILLIWIARLWRRAARGGLAEDPIDFAVRDPLSYLLAAAIGLLYLLASGTIG